MKSFNLNLPTQMFFGQGKISHLGEEILKRGTRVLLVYGGGSIKSFGLYDEVVKIFLENAIDFKELSGVTPNPRLSSVKEGIELIREHELDFILAVGGGSVIDCAKLISVAVDYDGDPWDFMTGKVSATGAVPLGTILTLSATGSEMNGNCVISKADTKEKLAFGSPYAYPAFTILDPTYTFTVNKHQTACGVADTLVHCYELYFSQYDNSFVSDSVLEGVMKSAIYFAHNALDNPKDYEARANISWASTMALNGVSGAGKDFEGFTHQLEHAISAIYDITHADGLTIISPHWMEYVLDETNVGRFARFARNVWNISETDEMAAAKKGIETMVKFFKSIDMPTTLAELNIDNSDFDEIIEKGMLGGDTLGTFKKLTKDDIRNILTNSLS